MPISCAVRGCLSQQGILTENGQKISFHRFPKDDDVKQKWLRNMRRDDWTPSKFSRLCSLHFEPCCYRGGSDKKILHSYAVPTIFTNQATVPEKIPIKRRIIMKTPSTASTSAVHEFKENVKPIKRKVSEGPCSNTTNAVIASTSATPFMSPCADTSEVSPKKIKLSEEPRTKTPSFALASTSATSCTAKSESHLKLCGSILEQCPLRCGAWIQRKHKDTHAKDCPKMEKNRSSSSPSHARNSELSPPEPLKNHTWSPRAVPLDDCVTYLEKEVANIKLVITEEVNQRDVQASDIESVRSKLVIVEERSQHFLSTLVSLRAAVDDEAERAANWAAQFKHDIANVQLALQELQSQQLTTAMRLESTVSSLLHEQRERELLETALAQHDNRIRAIHKLEDVIQYIKQTVEEERARNAESRAALEQELIEARRSSAQLGQLAVVNAQLQHTVHDRPEIDRVAVLELATTEARAETAEHAARVDIVTRDLRALTKSYLKMRSELADFQARVGFERPELGSDNGHLIWRIDRFTERMKDAKENDTVLSSPLFRTSKYGYTLKAELNLNGIGKWKGRHITCTIRLVGGPYDALLEWPCDIGVNVVLKDQPNNRSQAMDIVKSLQLRRKSSSKRHDYDSADEKTRSTETLDKTVTQLKRQYIFIPHTSLDKFEYVKGDVVFIEFLVNQ